MVGMPGAGKSTIGVLLAKETSLKFLDVDVYMQGCESRRLQDIIDKEGIVYFKELEEICLTTLDLTHHVISTGGSAIYSTKGIAHLKKTSVCIFLKVSLKTLEKRLGDFSTRGVVIQEGQSFEDLFNERNRLYSEAADLIVECDEKTQEEITLEIIECIIKHSLSVYLCSLTFWDRV